MIAIIGGGFFGCCIALHLRKKGEDVVILEAEHDIIRRASAVNQARIHNGYHYPRNFLTGFRSRANFDRFVNDFSESVVANFTKYYAIAKHDTKTSSAQFVSFCNEIGAFLEPAKQNDNTRMFFDSQMIDEIFLAKEYAFNANQLYITMKKRLLESKIEVMLNCNVEKLEQTNGSKIRILSKENGYQSQIVVDKVFNCTYSQMNSILHKSGLPTIPTKYELTEMCVVRVPRHLQRIGITVMDGPFFSLMPYPSEDLHTLSHVTYTPQHTIYDTTEDIRQVFRQYQLKTNFKLMLEDSIRFIPSLKYLEHVHSIWEMKAILPLNELDDGRPILFRKDHGLKNLTCILGGKLDNVYDVLDEIDENSQGEQRNVIR